jgi:hypothetical protein
MEGIGLGRNGILFGTGNVQVDDHWFLSAADDHGFDGLVLSGV